MNNINPNDYIKVAATSTVTLTDNTTLASPVVSMADYDAVMFVVVATDANADTTIDAIIQSDSAAAFGGPSTVTGSAITQDTLANASQAYILQVRADDLAAGETHVRCLATLGDGTTGGNTCIVALGLVANYLPGSNAATVIEVVTV